MSLGEVLSRSGEELRTWALAQESSALQRLFDEIWKEIRESHLYAGQPRSTESKRGVSLARACFEIATYCQEDRLKVQASRMLAYSLTANEQYEESLDYHERAIKGLENSGDADQAARARLGYIAALFHSGRYNDALAVATVAEEWFKKSNDELGFARLSNNVANLYDRLGEHAKAYQYHLTHSEIVRRLGDQEGLAKSYLNVGNSLARLDRFEDADQMYGNCESLSMQLGVTELESQASYNRAHLHYLRGRYTQAFQSFSRLRQHFEQSGSIRHAALCDLDEAEIYIQLNLPKDAAALAQRAADQFKQIGLQSEQGKATAFLGVALFQRGRFGEAINAFEQAQNIFAMEGNVYWGALLDLYRAEVHFAQLRYWEAHTLARRSKKLFEKMGFASKTILSLVLLGRIALALDEVSIAESLTNEILNIISKTTSPLLLFPCYMLVADIAQRKKEWEQAEHYYKMAAEDLELHQARLHHDDVRVTFFKGKNRVYEELVVLALRESRPQALAAAYARCERAKSRGLIELLSHHLPSIHGRSEETLVSKIERLREELNALYARTRPELGITPPAAAFDAIVSKEGELTRCLREAAIRDPEYTSLQQVAGATIETIQEVLPANTTALEYFIARDEVMAFVITRNSTDVIRRLCSEAEIADLQNRLAFHLEEFMLGEEYLRTHSDQILRATERHLKALYHHLFAPIEPLIKTSHVTVIPHGCLHLLPFHALTDGSRSVIDKFEISYAPSGAVLKYCLEKDDVQEADPCIVGVSDEMTPFVDEEVRKLSSIFPKSAVLLNDAAKRESFVKASRRTSFLHVATHGLFRPDNPMFSGFRLSDGWLTAVDLFGMTCETNLVTLSGCKSGISQVAGADDLLGLMRGFLYAGARSLMLSLWNIDDKCTSELMSRFYEAWGDGASRSKALNVAMKAVREKYPNPFYWSPFKLVGKS